MSRISLRCVAPLVAILVASLGLFAATADHAVTPSELRQVATEGDPDSGTSALAPSRAGHDAVVVKPASNHAPATVAKSVPVVVLPGGSLAWLAFGILGLALWRGSSADAPPRTHVRRRGPPTLLPA